MADQDLPVSGKDTRLQLLENGVPVAVTNQITNFNASRKVSQIETKPIGTSTVLIDQEPEGWEGTIELNPSTPSTSDLIDRIDAAQRARIPYSLQLVNTTNYRNGTSTSHMYPDVKVQYEESTQRGQANKIRVPWVTGLARIVL